MARVRSERERIANRERMRRYRQTEAGQSYQRDYRRRYRQTKAGREARRRGNARYRQGEAGREAWRRYRWVSHGITPEQAAWLLATQEGRCAIGRELLTLDTAQADHDHACCATARSCGRCIRGLVCRGCNQRVGYVERGKTPPTPTIAAYLARGAVTFPEVP